MKVIKLISLILTFFVTTGVFASALKNDSINLFLGEYQNGEKTGRVIHLDLFLLRNWDGKIKCDLTQEWFESDKNNKETDVSLSQEASNGTNGNLVKNLKWHPNKTIEFDYYAWGGNYVRFIGKKSAVGGKYDWDVIGEGVYKETDNAKPVKWLLKGMKEFTLEYPLIKLEPIYYNADAQ